MKGIQLKHIAGLFYVLIGLTGVRAQTENLRYQIKIKELVHHIEDMYVEELDADHLYTDFIKGMHNNMVPFNAYASHELMDALNLPKDMGKESIGINFKFKADSIVITDVLPGSGAEAAGIKKNDKIFTINDNKLDDLYYFIDVTRVLAGDSESLVKLGIFRNGDTLQMDVLRNPVPGHSFVVLGDYNNPKAINDYTKALDYFDTVYADSVPTLDIVETGIRYMLEQLDPHSTYISLEEMHDMNAPLQGSFTGVGVRFQIIKDTIHVVQTIPGGPSEKVGILGGDKFIYIDDVNVAGVGIQNNSVREKLLGEKGSKVAVSMKRKGSKELLDFIIERDKIALPSVASSYMVTSKIGYIKLTSFAATSMEEVSKAIAELKAAGMKDLVLDLQSNGGGYLMTAVNLADAFLKDNKLVVYTNGRKFPKHEYGKDHYHDFEKGKLVVLVDENSASASEIVSGAVQDWDRGLVVGRRTFGKGLVQKPINLSDGTQVRITTQRYYTPSGRCIQKPYEDGSIAYRREKYTRYNSGETFHQDSIKINDSVPYATLLRKRTVYGGGGVMPDVFVPLDTTGSSKYFSALIRKGILNQFCLTYTNDNREKMNQKYSDFAQFKKDFRADKVVKELIDYATSEGLEFDKAEYEKAENTILIRLKANIAQNLYDVSKFYEIVNELNETLVEAVKIIEQGSAFKILE